MGRPPGRSPARSGFGRTRRCQLSVRAHDGTWIDAAVTSWLDASTDPGPARAAIAGTWPHQSSTNAPVAVNFVYHDPGAELVVLVLAPHHRELELAARLQYVADLAQLPWADVPRYACEAACVVGLDGLSAHLESRAEAVLASGRLADGLRDLDRRRQEQDERSAQLEAQRGELLRVGRELSAARTELAQAQADVTQAQTELAQARAARSLVAPVVDHVPPVVPGSAAAEPDATTVDGDRPVWRLPQATPAKTADWQVCATLARGPGAALIGIHVGPFTLAPTDDRRRASLWLDPEAPGDRAWLELLARAGGVVLRPDAGPDTFVTGDLADNIALIRRLAREHERSRQGAPRELAATRALVAEAGFDRFATRHPDAAELREDKLAQLDSPAGVRRALAIVDRFGRSGRDVYLFAARGVPVPRWRAVTRTVLVRAVACGVWMGQRLAARAVQEGLATDQASLVAELQAAFARSQREDAGFDLDDDAASDNVLELARAQAALAAPIATPDVVAGEIQTAPPATEARRGGLALRDASDAVLEAQLDHRDGRLEAALALCARAQARHVPAILAAAAKLSRADAVRVLGALSRVGPEATPALIAAIDSPKPFVRQGCALLLAMARRDDASDAVIGLLFREPSEIWREIARAVGQIGPAGLVPLARHLTLVPGQVSASDRERAAWAMAHIAVRGGQKAIEAFAGGQSAVAPVAALALDLVAPAARDELRERRGGTGSGVRDVTVNRAFSRRFYEQLEAQAPASGQPELVAMDRSEPMELLDAELLEAEVEAEFEADADLVALDDADVEPA